MSCSGCGVNGSKPQGCNNNGACSTGGCNRLNTFNWLADIEVEDFVAYEVVEISFKHGARKDFFQRPTHLVLHSGDMVVIDSGSGYDLGRVTLTGELVRLQMKKKNVHPDRIIRPVVRKANHRDLERLEEARELESKTLVRARAISRMLDLDMKIADIEYQGDKRKATFYFTANGRVDFRELIRHYAKEFRVKIEMRQIGSRQESSRIGGIGSCGRELCCSTWLTNFKSVSTKAARYQNLSINQAKLSGQCGRLKCCLNYELDLYMESLEAFPIQAESIQAKTGRATLLKIDIFKKLMYYLLPSDRGRDKLLTLPVDRVRAIQQMNREGVLPDEFLEPVDAVAEIDLDFADVTGEIVLKDLPKKRKGGRRKGNHRGKRRSPRKPGNK
ncbi:MAG: regulatory iron-sulfur-containing complex subunit RicT [Saprospiraceae bacterium]|nr:regulatory iron-sulfur-containing complex subunit RicT [Saprospiraceae bacterium]